jgi:hypothetical protein
MRGRRANIRFVRSWPAYVASNACRFLVCLSLRVPLPLGFVCVEGLIARILSVKVADSYLSLSDTAASAS